MAFHYEESSSGMLRKLMGSELDNITVKSFLLDNYGSIKALKNQASIAGNWQAKGHLSMAYKDGIPELNIEKDLDKATGWLESSIDHGNPYPSRICELGTLYDIKGTIPFQRKAHEMYQKAARFGGVQAELNLAESYRCGIEGVVNKDLEEAFKWYRRAAGEERGDYNEDIPKIAAMMRGTLRKIGDDVKLKALQCLHKYYMSGECPEEKPQPLKAIYYLTKAAEAGHVESQTELGLSYLTGVSEVPKDLEKAKRWLKKAANKGSIEAKKVLDKFSQQGVIEAQAVDIPPEQQDFKPFLQFHEMVMGKIEQLNECHPYVIEDPLMYHESMFTQFPESPTAQNYLKAFKLAEEGLSELKGGNFKKAVKLFAYSYLYENTVLQTFPQTRMPAFTPNIITMILQELQVDEDFFEGLLLLSALCPMSGKSPKVNFKSFKRDLKDTMFIKNFIHLIRKYEINRLPNANPYSFEESYSSWLHVLYYLLASHYTVAERYDDGAQAFEKALEHCPKYYEAKDGLGYCLMNLSLMKKNEKREDACDLEEQLNQLQSIPKKDQRVLESSYLRWSQDALKKKAKKMFMEYLEEAPVCDKKYPNCNYHLAYLYKSERNIQKALEWKARGEDAEEKRLPFMGPVSAGVKPLLDCLDMLPIPKQAMKKRCSYKECSKKEVEQLKSCPCKQVSYCGRDCQKMHWKEHKKTCSSKSKIK